MPDNEEIIKVNLPTIGSGNESLDKTSLTAGGGIPDDSTEE